jgi:hypothetical protein
MGLAGTLGPVASTHRAQARSYNRRGVTITVTYASPMIAFGSR